MTHGVLSGSALKRVEETEGLQLLVVTNTIPQVGTVQGQQTDAVVTTGSAKIPLSQLGFTIALL